MIQFILTLIEDFILSVFIMKTCKIKKSSLYFIAIYSACIIETTFIEYVPSFSKYFTIMISLTLVLLVYLVKKKLILEDVIACIIGPSLIIITNLVSLLIFSTLLNVSLIEIITDSSLLLTASFFAKMIYFFFLYFISKKFINAKSNLLFEEWWSLIPIMINIFILVYYLGDSLVLREVTVDVLYKITLLLVTLSIFCIILFHKILITNEKIKNHELLEQKALYLKENSETVRRMSKEISIVEHELVYNLIYIRNLVKENDKETLHKFLNERIFNARKYKNFIYTENHHFDYLLNLKLRELTQKGIDTNININSKSSKILSNQSNSKIIIDILEYVCSNLKLKETVTIEGRIENKTILFKFIFVPEIVTIDDIKKECNNISKRQDIEINTEIIENLVALEVIIGDKI